jgi:hypothetical protein
MKRMSENEMIIHLLEQVLTKLDDIEQRMENQDAKFQRHITVKHPYRSMGKRHGNQHLQDTQVPGRY